MHEMYVAIELPIHTCDYFTTTKDMSPGFQQRHKMMRDTIYYLIIVIYYFWYFYVKNVILGLGNLFPCF